MCRKKKRKTFDELYFVESCAYVVICRLLIRGYLLIKGKIIPNSFERYYIRQTFRFYFRICCYNMHSNHHGFLHKFYCAKRLSTTSVKTFSAVFSVQYDQLHVLERKKRDIIVVLRALTSFRIQELSPSLLKTIRILKQLQLESWLTEPVV